MQVDLLRKAGCERRAELARSLSRTVIDLSRAALRERLPGISEQEMLFRWLAIHYGADLERRVRAYIEARSHE